MVRARSTTQVNWSLPGAGSFVSVALSCEMYMYPAPFITDTTIHLYRPAFPHRIVSYVSFLRLLYPALHDGHRRRRGLVTSQIFHLPQQQAL